MAPKILAPHGPKLSDIFINPPQSIVVQWILSLLCWWACIFCYIRHRHSLYSTPDSRLRKHYLMVVAFPLVISSLSLVCMLSVRPAYMWFLFQKLYEARTLYSFMKVLMILLGRDPEKIATKLRTGIPQPVIAAPPLLCWLYPCTKPIYAPLWLIKLIPDLVFQFVLLVPLTGVVELWLSLDGYASNIPQMVEIFSMFVAMQGLFILYIASHEFLKSYNPTRKFVCIKMIVIIAAVQKFVIESATPPDLVMSRYDSHALVNIWQCFLLSLESVIFSIVMTYAFPVTELIKFQNGGDTEDPGELKNLNDIELEEGKTKLIPTRDKGPETLMNELTPSTGGLLHRQESNGKR